MNAYVSSIIVTWMYLCIFSLYNDAFPLTKTTQRQMKGDKYELEIIWKVATMA
jgi:hypothetical protein